MTYVNAFSLLSYLLSEIQPTFHGTQVKEKSFGKENNINK